MNLSKMKVSTRLIWGFGVVIVAALSIALFARYELGTIDDSMKSLIDDRMVKFDLTNQVIDNINAQAIASRDITLSSDDKMIAQETARIKQARARNVEIYKELDARNRSAEGRAQLQAALDARDRFNKALDKSLALGAADDNFGAQQVLMSEGRPLQDAYLASLNAMLEHQKKQMQVTADKTGNMVSSAGLLMLLMAALAAALGTAAAWLIIRNLSQQLGGEPAYAAKVAREIAAGNLTVEVRLQPGDQGSMLASMKGMRDSLAQVVGSVRQGSESVATASQQIAEGNADLSARTESQASALEETAASMEELGSTVQQNADSARQANQLAQSASTVAVQGGEVVAQVVDTMQGINDASRKIADIISVIDGIAFQTNILALNAAVEAARAGEEGRGFAVVASEVRALAGRSAEAAKEIKQLITDSVARVEQGTVLVDRAGSTMAEVVASIRRVTDIMGEISAASSEQSAGVAQVGEAVTQMDQATQQNAALVEEMAAAADSLKNQAQDLVQVVSVFQLPEQAALTQLPRKERRAANQEAGLLEGPDRRQYEAAAPVLQLPVPAAEPKLARTGTDDGWSSF